MFQNFKTLNILKIQIFFELSALVVSFFKNFPLNLSSPIFPFLISSSILLLQNHSSLLQREDFSHAQRDANENVENVEGSKKIENYVDVVKLGSFGG